jgi:hypothetical protein
MANPANNAGSVSFRKGFYRLYLLKSKENMDLDLLAKRIMSLDNVLEVFLTDGIGDYGCVVKSREHGSTPAMGSKICKKTGMTASEIMAISYRR